MVRIYNQVPVSITVSNIMRHNGYCMFKIKDVYWNLIMKFKRKNPHIKCTKSITNYKGLK